MSVEEQEIVQRCPDLQQGDTVYVVITPSTPHQFLECYRPKPYFVLETTVVGEHNLPAHRTFGTGFLVHLDCCFKNQYEAKSKLTRIFTEETGGTIALGRVVIVTQQEEQDGNRAINKKLMERHGLPL